MQVVFIVSILLLAGGCVAHRPDSMNTSDTDHINIFLGCTTWNCDGDAKIKWQGEIITAPFCHRRALPDAHRELPVEWIRLDVVEGNHKEKIYIMSSELTIGDIFSTIGCIWSMYSAGTSMDYPVGRVNEPHLAALISSLDAAYDHDFDNIRIPTFQEWTSIATCGEPYPNNNDILDCSISFFRDCRPTERPQPENVTFMPIGRLTRSSCGARGVLGNMLEPVAMENGTVSWAGGSSFDLRAVIDPGQPLPPHPPGSEVGSDHGVRLVLSTRRRLPTVSKISNR